MIPPPNKAWGTLGKRGEKNKNCNRGAVLRSATLNLMWPRHRGSHHRCAHLHRIKPVQVPTQTGEGLPREARTYLSGSWQLMATGEKPFFLEGVVTGRLSILKKTTTVT